MDLLGTLKIQYETAVKETSHYPSSLETKTTTPYAQGLINSMIVKLQQNGMKGRLKEADNKFKMIFYLHRVPIFCIKGYSKESEYGYLLTEAYLYSTKKRIILLNMGDVASTSKGCYFVDGETRVDYLEIIKDMYNEFMAGKWEQWFR